MNNIDLGVLSRVEVTVPNKEKSTSDGTVHGKKATFKERMKESQQRKGRVNRVEGRKLGKSGVICTG